MQKFDESRAKRYIRGALAITVENDSPVLYFKPGWGTAGRGAEVSEDLAKFLQNGCRLSNYANGVDLNRTPNDVREMICKGLVGMGFGAQILPGRHFTMCTNGGDVYGCAVGGPDGTDSSEPLAYRRALSPEAVEVGVQAVAKVAGLTALQAENVRFALQSLGIKVTPIFAYQAETEADCQPIETVIKGRTEATHAPQIGDYIVKQTNGEVTTIKPDRWEAFGYIEDAG